MTSERGVSGSCRNPKEREKAEASSRAERVAADIIDREERMTWPTVKDSCGFGIVRRYVGAPELSTLLPGAFIHPDLTEDEVQAIRQALTRTLTREIRKIWRRRLEERVAAAVSRDRTERAAVATGEQTTTHGQTTTQTGSNDGD